MIDDTFEARKSAHRSKFLQTLSEHDQLILKASDADLEQMISNTSFDEQTFYSRIRAADGWQSLMLGYLYLDHVITLSVTENMHHSEAVDMRRFPLSQRLDLAYAFLILPLDCVNMARQMIKLRNRIAHDLEFTIGQKEISQFRSVIPKRIKEALMPDRTKLNVSISLQDCIILTVMNAEAMRQLSHFNRLRARHGELRLREALSLSKNL